MVDLRQLDAFQKTDPSFRIEQGTNVLRQAVFAAVAIFVLYLESSALMGAKPEFSFDVARGVQDTFQINLDLVMMAPCAAIGMFIEDVSGDRLFVNELVRAEGVVPPHLALTPAARTLPEEEKWCRVSGQFDANRVRGRLSVIPSRAELFNASHEIVELSFGEYFPALLNPLDHTRAVLAEPGAISYQLAIFPTTVHAFGATLTTNQYSVDKAERTGAAAAGAQGVHFNYDFEPLSVDVRDERIPFLMWAARLINIGGGVVFLTRLLRQWVLHDRVVRDEKGLLG